jgi:hypothetical protein
LGREGKSEEERNQKPFHRGYYKDALRLISLNNVFPNSKASSVRPSKFKFCPLGKGMVGEKFQKFPKLLYGFLVLTFP